MPLGLYYRGAQLQGNQRHGIPYSLRNVCTNILHVIWFFVLFCQIFLLAEVYSGRVVGDRDVPCACFMMFPLYGKFLLAIDWWWKAVVIRQGQSSAGEEVLYARRKVYKAVARL